MPRRHRNRYRRRDDRPTNGEVLIEALFSGVAAAVVGLVRLFARLIAPPHRNAPPPPETIQRLRSARSRDVHAPPPALAPTITPAPQALSQPPLAQLVSSPAVLNTATYPEPLPYRRARHLLSKGERSFWYPLYRAVKGKYRIFCKVRLADVITAAPALRRDERKWFRKISSYHLDFVICHPHTTEPLLVIELDDRSHRSPKRQRADSFKEEVLAAAKVPIIRLAASQAYDPREIAQKIERMIRRE